MRFEIGRNYQFVTGPNPTEWIGQVVEVNFPLIRVKPDAMDTELIINAACLTFRSATILPLRSAEEKASASGESVKASGATPKEAKSDPFDPA